MQWKREKQLPQDQLLALYESVNWTAYTQDPASLLHAISQSSYVSSLWSEEGQLIGLLRCLTDEVSILYVQDLLVNPAFQRQGLGKQLLQDCLQRFHHVRQKVLLADDETRLNAFYQSLGFSNTRTLSKHKLNAFVRIEGTNLQ